MPLIDAVLAEDLEQITLLWKSSSPEEQQKAFRKVIRAGKVKSLRYLLELGMRVDQDIFDESPLLIAAQNNGHLNGVFECLLEYKWWPGKSEKERKLAVDEAKTDCLDTIIKEDDYYDCMALCKFLLQEGWWCSGIDELQNAKDLALANAADLGNEELTQFLLDNGADPTENFGDKDAFEWAASNDHYEVLRLLSAATKKTLICHDDYIKEALTYVGMHGHLELLRKLLMPEFWVKAEECVGGVKSALLGAISRGHADVIEYVVLEIAAIKKQALFDMMPEFMKVAGLTQQPIIWQCLVGLKIFSAGEQEKLQEYAIVASAKSDNVAFISGFLQEKRKLGMQERVLTLAMMGFQASLSRFENSKYRFGVKDYSLKFSNCDVEIGDYEISKIGLASSYLAKFIYDCDQMSGKPLFAKCLKKFKKNKFTVVKKAKPKVIPASVVAKMSFEQFVESFESLVKCIPSIYASKCCAKKDKKVLVWSFEVIDIGMLVELSRKLATNGLICQADKKVLSLEISLPFSHALDLSKCQSLFNLMKKYLQDNTAQLLNKSLKQSKNKVVESKPLAKPGKTRSERKQEKAKRVAIKVKQNQPVFFELPLQQEVLSADEMLDDVFFRVLGANKMLLYSSRFYGFFRLSVEELCLSERQSSRRSFVCNS